MYAYFSNTHLANNDANRPHLAHGKTDQDTEIGHKMKMLQIEVK